MKGIARDIPIREEITTVVFTKNDRRVPTGVDKPSSILCSLTGESVRRCQCDVNIRRWMWHGMSRENDQQETIREG
jgi:hypothetical protein